MPGGDRTGPWGAGPRTGRAAGYCAGYGVPGYMNPLWGGMAGGGWGLRGAGRGGLPWGGGRGRAWGGGRGPGWGYGRYGAYPPAYYPTPYEGPYAPEITKEQETSELKAQAQYFQNTLKEIEKRLKELERPDDKKKT